MSITADSDRSALGSQGLKSCFLGCREMEAHILMMLETCVKDRDVREMFMRYYGFRGGEPATLMVLGKEFGLSAEGVRLRMQRTRVALRTDPRVLELLTPYFNDCPGGHTLAA